MKIKEITGNIELYLLIILVFLLPFGQLIKLPLNITGINVYFTDPIIVLLTIIYFFKNIKSFSKKQLNSNFKPIFAFVVIACFSLLINAYKYAKTEIIISSLYLARWIVYASLYFISFNIFKHKKNMLQKFSDLLIITISFSAFLGLLQYIFIPDVSSLKGLGWDPHYYRIIGTYFDPGFSGIIYLIGIILIFSKKISFKLQFYHFSLLFLFLAMMLTYSRSTYLAFLVVTIFTAVYKKSREFLFLVLTIFFVSLLLLPRPGGEGVKLERVSSSVARVNNWQQSLVLSLQFPLFGQGFDTLRYVQRNFGLLSLEKWQESHAGAGFDSSLLTVFTTTGIAGLIIFIWIYLKLFKANYNSYSLIVKTLILALAVHSLFNNTILYNWVMLYFWIITGSASAFMKNN